MENDRYAATVVEAYSAAVQVWFTSGVERGHEGHPGVAGPNADATSWDSIKAELDAAIETLRLVRARKYSPGIVSQIDFFPDTRIYVIDGMRFTEECLHALCGRFPNDRSYRFVQRDGVVSVTVRYDGEGWIDRLIRHVRIWWIGFTTSPQLRRQIRALRESTKK